MTDIATLGLKVDGLPEINQVANALDKLTGSVSGAEKSLEKLDQATKRAKKEKKELADETSKVAEEEKKVAEESDKSAKAIDKTAESSKKAKKAKDELADSNRKVAKEEAATVASSSSAEASNDKLNASIKSLVASNKILFDSVKSLSTTVSASAQAYQSQTQSVNLAANAMQSVAAENKAVAAAAQASVGSINAAAAAMGKLSAGVSTSPKSDGLPRQLKNVGDEAKKAEKPVVQLAEAERKLAEQAARAGQSVNQFKANLRGLPAQFTDIAVSLQGGQAPLTVFLQQGGQLKDMFGGAGNAARAMGGYITGLINPFSLAATAVIALGAAYYSGTREQDAFRISLATTGNAIGETAGSLAEYSKQIAESTGTQGKASESLNLFVQAGVRAEGELARFTETAIRWEKATGEGVDAVAEKFAALQKDPLSSALKLNESMNFLTLSTYEQIKALEDQGDAAAASALAMSELDRAMAERSKNIEQNLGSIERGWNAVASAAKGAWDWMLNIGRQASLTERLATEQEKLVKLESEVVGLYEKGTHAKRLTEQRERVQLLMDEHAQSELNAAADKTRSEQVSALAGFHKQYANQLKEELPLAKQLAKARADGAAAGASEAEITQIVNKLTEDYNKKNKVRVASTKAIENSYRTLAERAAEYVKSLELEAQQGEKISKSQQLEIELQSLLVRGKGKGTDAAVKQTKALIAEAKAMETQAKARKAMAEAAEQYQKDLEEIAEYQKKESEAVAKQAQATYEAGKALANESRMLELQAGLIGASTQARELAIEQLRIQIDLEKELEALDANKDLTLDARETAKTAARERAVQRGANAEKKILIDSYNEIGKYVEDSLYDAIVTGGASAGEALERMFKNMVLQPIVKAGVQDLMGMVGLGGEGQGGGGFSNLLSTGKSIYEAVTGQNSMLNSIGNWIGLGGSATSSSIYSLTASGAAAASSAAATGGSIYSLASGGSLGLGASGVGLSAPTTGYFAGSSAAGGASTGSLGGLSAAWPAAIVAGMIMSNKLFSAGIDQNSRDKGGKVIGYGNKIETDILGKIVGDRVANVLTGAPVMSWTFSKLGLNGGTSDYGAAAQYAGGELAASGKQFTKQELTASYAESLQPTIDALAVTVGSSLDSFSALFGKGVGYRVQTGFTSDNDDPSRGNFIVEKDGETLEKWLSKRSGEFGRRVTGQSYAKSGEEGYDDYLKAVTAATIPLFRDIVPTWADTMLDEFSSAVGFSGDGNDWKSISGTGADASAALNAVLVQIAQVEAAFVSLGQTMPMFANLTDDVKSSLMGSLGGFDGFSSAANTFYNAFYSEAERMEELSRQVEAAAGIDPRTGEKAKEQFRAAVEAALQGGQGELAAQLLSLSGTFATTADYAQQLTGGLNGVSEILAALREEEHSLWADLAEAEGDFATAAQRRYWIETEGMTLAEQAAYDYNAAIKAQISSAQAATAALGSLGATQWDLENQLLGLQGRGMEVEERTRTKELGDLLEGVDDDEKRKQITASYDYNASLRKQIEAMQQAAQAAQASASAQSSAADKVRSSWQSIGDSIINEINRIRGVVAEDSEYGMAYYQARFATASAQARAGDQEAADALPAISQALLRLAESNASTSLELQRIRNQTAASLERTVGTFGITVPSLSVGTNYVQQSGLAMIHQGEAVVPRAYNPSAGGAGQYAELIAEIRSLKEEFKAIGTGQVTVSARTAKMLERWNIEGLPETRDEATL